MKSNPPRFSVFLIALLLIMVVNPLLTELGVWKAQLLLNISFGVIFLAGLYALSERKGRFYFVIALAAGSAILAVFEKIYATSTTDLALLLFVAAFLLTMIVFILQRTVLTRDRVTWEKISAALCVYLLAGYFWACLYTFADHIHPGSFNNNLRGFPDLLYFSLVTLATVGYGDITPATPFARSLAVLEAISGQFYLAVMIARLVGLQIVHSDSATTNEN